MNAAQGIRICLIGLLFLATMVSIHAESASPEGYWKTIDDETGEVKSIVKVWIDETATLRGRIVKIFPKPDEDPDPVCDKCKGKLKDKKIIGMVFMWGFKRRGDQWVDGEIVDPENGKKYHCRVHTEKGGGELKVYGYIRVIVKIGRTQTWIRTDQTALSW